MSPPPIDVTRRFATLKQPERTDLQPPGLYFARRRGPNADAEVALELGGDREIVGFAAALELVDLAASDDAQQIVADNIFHRAVVFGPIGPTRPARAIARLIVNGEVRAQARVPSNDYPQVVDAVGRLLAGVDERICAGDRLIAGAIVQVPVAAGDHVIADLGVLGRAEARISSHIATV